MKQDNSGKIAIHEKKSLISIVYTNLHLKSKVHNSNDGKA